MELIANRQLHGVYGTVAPGKKFDVDDQKLGEELVKRGLATATDGQTYQTKAVRPAQTKGVQLERK